jgi:uncharacterized damage-inducible protein DinB
MNGLPRLESTRLADQFERSFRGGAWHGPALAEAIDGVDAETAHRRAIAGAHTVAEVVFHVAYWLDGVRRRLDGGAVDGDDWPVAGVRPDWDELVATLERNHRALHAAVAALDDARLDDPVEGSDPTVRGMLLGLLQHNAYHAGQLVLLARAAREAGA